MAEIISYRTISMWRVPALKDYLRKRNMKTSGRKDELVARVFAAMEQNIPESPTASEMSAERHLFLVSLLTTPEGNILPDPMSLGDGWVGEDRGMEMWPSIFLSDITMYIMANHPGNDVPLQQRLLNEYKEGKAYRLYTGGWLKEIFYHAVSQHSEYCFLKANCCHTMKIGDVPHTVWICVLKKTGDIKSAYCSCTAGLGCSCIHITAMFFRVEAAVRTGQTNVACTSKLCQWNIPAKKTHIEPLRVKDMDFKVSKFSKGHDVSIDTVESVKHGRTLEPEAKKAYIELMKSKHEGFGHRECGLFVDKHKPYLGASPDLVNVTPGHLFVTSFARGYVKMTVSQ
ncbi:uncharacterized protein [Ptychodera flava]|uniref:uncharacterized protein n=1 Tax=Ptychodera flava TaxID=63121 RepID=UPI00396AAFBF